MPKVSVIVPVYNVERYLGECLDSVRWRTLGEFEVICVNDGSIDGSVAICADYAARDGRVKVITQANGGLSTARGAGCPLCPQLVSGIYGSSPVRFPQSSSAGCMARMQRR